MHNKGALLGFPYLFDYPEQSLISTPRIILRTTFQYMPLSLLVLLFEYLFRTCQKVNRVKQKILHAEQPILWILYIHF